MRRVKGIKAAREVFKLGREDRRAGFQLYIAAADMEYYCTKVYLYIFFREKFKDIYFLIG
jgi:hypothetical protein